MKGYVVKAIGADPEFFLRDKSGRPVPSIGLIGGDKQHPRHINDDGYSAVQEDNVMVEYNIKPARTADEFVKNHKLVLNYLTEFLEKKGLKMNIVPVMEFKKKQLKHPQAREIGCEGDMNAWTWKPNLAPNYKSLKLFRTAGAHVHVSYEFDGHAPTPEDQIKLVRAMDLALGVPSVLLDSDMIRREFYGRAGAFRPKEYGVEYRTLSNFWIYSDKLVEWVFNQVIWIADEINRPGVLDEMVHDDNRVRDCINGAVNARLYARDVANTLIKKYGIRMPG